VKCSFVPPRTVRRIQANEEEEKKDSEFEKEIRAQRQNVIDAVIVRIMKSRKTDIHNNLVEECCRQISIFRPEIQMIKTRIESLIERDYLKRDENERGRYIYLP
jgi:cullin 3